MNFKMLIHILVIAAVIAGCGSFKAKGHGGSDPASVAGGTATRGDMSNILGDVEAKRPYSRYLYRVAGMDGQESVSGIISIAQGGDENLRLVVTGRELRVIQDESFRRSYNLETTDSDNMSFNGGYAAGGRLAIMPGLYIPVEFYPQWFPANADVSVDIKCNLLIRMKKVYANETQGLVAFMDARNRLEGLTCEMLGTFDTIPQLKKLVRTLRGQKKYNGEHYVLRLSWGSTFALVTIAGERGKK